jgi:hypothetical protein
MDPLWSFNARQSVVFPAPAGPTISTTFGNSLFINMFSTGETSFSID